MKLHVVYVIRIWVDIRKIHTSKLTKCLTSMVIFEYHFVKWCKLKINTIGIPSDLSVCLHAQAMNKKVYRRS